MGKWVHRLSNIDPDKRTAECDNCGKVSIRRKSTGKKADGVSWACSVARSQWSGRSNRSNYLMHRKDNCEKCGFIPIDICQLDVDHIDGNHNNNAPTNLQTLCANCHRLKTFRISLYEKASN